MRERLELFTDLYTGLSTGSGVHMRMRSPQGDAAADRGRRPCEEARLASLRVPAGVAMR